MTTVIDRVMPAPCEYGDALLEVPRNRHLMRHIDLAHLGHWDPSFIDSMTVDPSQWGRWLCNLVPVRCADQDCFTEGVFEKLKTDVASQGMMFGKPGHLLAYAALSKGRSFQKTVVCIDPDKTFSQQENYFPGVFSNSISPRVFGRILGSWLPQISVSLLVVQRIDTTH